MDSSTAGLCFFLMTLIPTVIIPALMVVVMCGILGFMVILDGHVGMAFFLWMVVPLIALSFMFLAYIYKFFFMYGMAALISYLIDATVG
ncbi:unnamed protein product [Clonostachys rosea]|uniref:ABC transmembrane type-1 domain-containing protein n=1 Tax=Bionectria ochroleuca TaxID=29856 RepID=A0ABY6UBW6_BIOOC|nr:unnamed protein product [Clonostachys rosea]